MRKLVPRYAAILLAAFFSVVVPAAAGFGDDKATGTQAGPTADGAPAARLHPLHHSVRHDVHILEYRDTTWNLPAASVITPIMNATVYDAGWWDTARWQWQGGIVFNSSAAFRLRNTQGLQDWYFDHGWHHGEYVAHCEALKLPTSQADSKGGTDAARDGVYLSLLHIWNTVFQHIVIDTIPKLSFVCPFLSEHQHTMRVKVLVHNALQRDLVQEFCPLPADRFEIFSAVLQAAQVLVPHFVGLDNVPLYNGMSPPRSIAPRGPAALGDTVVYLAREQGARRSVTNELEVLRVLRARYDKVEVFYPSGDWRLDRRAVSKAALLIGPHGGAFGNMIFAPNNTKIVEFLPLRALENLNAGLEAQVERTLALRENARPAFLGLAVALGFRYKAR